MNKITKEGIELIKEFETLRLKSYLCPAGKPTIGWGHTGPEVKLGMEITEAKATDYLYRDIETAGKSVRVVKVPINDNQFSALVSFVFNLGGGNFFTSTLLKKINAKDFEGAAAEFKRWNKCQVRKKDANGKDLKDANGNFLHELIELPGLTRRRADEKEMFLKA